MSCIQISACSTFPPRAFGRSKADICTSSYLGKKLPTLKLTSAASRYQHTAVAPVCLFGGKGKSENGNQDSPWKAIEQAVGNFKKDQSVEDVLRQQIEKQEFYDDGDGGGKGSGGGGGGGDGFGEDENEDDSGVMKEFGQVILATLGFVFLYIYIIEAEEINVLTKDILKFVFTRQKSIRLNRLINQWKGFLERMKEKEEDDPIWLERAIINTPTWFDSPDKYMYIIRESDDTPPPQDEDSYSDDYGPPSDYDD